MVKKTPQQLAAYRNAYAKMTPAERQVADDEGVRLGIEEEERLEQKAADKKAADAEERQHCIDWDRMVDDISIINEETRLCEDKRIAFIQEARVKNQKVTKVIFKGKEHLPPTVLTALADLKHLTQGAVTKQIVREVFVKHAVTFDVNNEEHWAKILRRVKNQRKSHTKEKAAAVVGVDLYAISSLSENSQCSVNARGYRYHQPKSTVRLDQLKYGSRWGITGIDGPVGGLRRIREKNGDSRLLDNHPYQESDIYPGRAFAEDFDHRSPGLFFNRPANPVYKRRSVADAFMMEYEYIKQQNPAFAYEISLEFLKTIPTCAEEADRVETVTNRYESAIAQTQRICRDEVEEMQKKLSEAEHALKIEKADNKMELAQTKIDLAFSKTKHEELHSMALFCNTKLSLLQATVPLNFMPFPWHFVSSTETQTCFSKRAKVFPMAMANDMSTYHNEIGRFLLYSLHDRILAIRELCCLYRHIFTGRRMLFDLVGAGAEYNKLNHQGEDAPMEHFLHHYVGTIIPPSGILTFIRIQIDKHDKNLGSGIVAPDHLHMYKYFQRYYTILQREHTMERPLTFESVSLLGGAEFDYSMYPDEDHINDALHPPYSRYFNWKNSMVLLRDEQQENYDQMVTDRLISAAAVTNLRREVTNHAEQIDEMEETIQENQNELIEQDEVIEQLQDQVLELETDNTAGRPAHMALVSGVLDSFFMHRILPSLVPGQQAFPFSPLVAHRGPQTCILFCNRTYSVGTCYYNTGCCTPGFICNSCITLMLGSQLTCAYCRHQF